MLARTFPGFVFLLFAAVSHAAPAVDLAVVYAQAKSADAAYLGQVAATEAVREGETSARAGLLPSVQASANTNWNQNTSSGGAFAGVFDYNSNGYSLSLTQPLFRRDRWVQYEQAQLAVKQAETQLDAALQELMVRVTGLYLDVLSAQDDLEFAQKTKAAIAKQLEQAKERFDVGLIAVTGVDEAQARYDLTVADEIAARNGIRNAWEALREVTHEYHDALAGLADTLALVRPDPEDIDAWTRTALAQNLNVASAAYGLQIANEEVSRRQAGHLPSLDLVGTHSYAKSNGGSFGANTSRGDVIGLQLSLPIDVSGGVRAQVRQAERQYDQSMQQLEQARRAAQRQSREAYRAVVDSIALVNAREQALKSTRTALRATEAGFDAGTRTTVDVLDAQRDMFGAIRDFKASRYNYVRATLSLKQAAGTLSEADVEAVNAWLQH